MDRIRLSKEISYALRHAPERYGLHIDEDGWVDIDTLLQSLHKKDGWRKVDKYFLQEMVTQSARQRFEIKDHKIRALYGHSRSLRITKEPHEPPEMLFHGTSRRSVQLIKKQGLHPRGRLYVHLSIDIETAQTVGMRHDIMPVVLKVLAKKAWNDGILFYRGSHEIWLSENIPTKYVIVA